MALATGSALAQGPRPGGGGGGGGGGTGDTGTPPAASAGCGGQVLLSDDFSQVDPAWSLGEGSTIVGGKLRIKAKPGYGYRVIYGGAVFGNADMCVDLTMPEARNPDGATGGLLFHFHDWDNYVSVIVSASGYLTVQRYDNKQFLSPVAWRKVPNLKTGAGAVNSLRATWSGSSLAIYVNGTHVVTGKLIGLTGKGPVGVVGYSEKAAENVWQFDNFVVSAVPK